MFAMLIVGISVSLDAQNDSKTARKAQREANHEARQQKRAERLAEYERFLDSLILSHNFRFVPQNMQIKKLLYNEKTVLFCRNRGYGPGGLQSAGSQHLC